MGHSSAPAASGDARGAAATELAVEVPGSSLDAPYSGAALQTPSHGAGTSDGLGDAPAWPLNIQSLLNRPFGDVLREILSGYQLKSTAAVASEQLRYLVVHRDHDTDVLASPALLGHLMAQLREAPGLPAAGSCMGVLAQVARMPGGRAQLRAEVTPLLRFLSMPGVLQKANAGPALLLLQNLTADKVCRSMVGKADGVPLLVGLLGQDTAHLKQQPNLAAHLTGCLLNLVAGDGELSAAKQAFVTAGGMEVACRALADWGRYDTSQGTLRLRLLLADLGKLQQYGMRLHQKALDACTSSRARPISPSQPAQGSTAHGSLGTVQPAAAPAYRACTPGSNAASMLALVPDVVAMAGKGIPLGTPRMPASDRITAAVLAHGKDMAGDGQGGECDGIGLGGQAGASSTGS